MVYTPLNVYLSAYIPLSDYEVFIVIILPSTAVKQSSSAILLPKEALLLLQPYPNRLDNFLPRIHGHNRASRDATLLFQNLRKSVLNQTFEVCKESYASLQQRIDSHLLSLFYQEVAIRICITALRLEADYTKFHGLSDGLSHPSSNSD